MRYSRGRIFALAILSVMMALALFCTGYVFDWRNSFSRAANNSATDNTEVPGFDDLYQRIPYDKLDTGSVTMGKNTKLTLVEERYNRDVLTNFLNASAKRSYSELQGKRHENYPYPIFTNSEMRSIANGMGNNLNIPVIMLDSSNYDDIVLFELTNLVSTPEQLSVTRDGLPLSDNIFQVDAMLDADLVYAGVPDGMLTAKREMIFDAENEVEVLSVTFNPTTTVIDGYVVEIRDLDDEFMYTLDESTLSLKPIETIENGITELYDNHGVFKFCVERNNEEVKVYDATQNPQKLLGTALYNKDDNQLVNYQIGAVACNGNAVRGMFQDEGFYQVSFKQKITSGEGILSEVNVSFAFIIVNKIDYTDFPRFNTKHRALGNAEIYNYSYESEYPTVTYLSSCYDVQIQANEKYNENDPINDERELSFYNIGEYKMVSSLQCYNAYLAGREQEFSRRGVSNGIVKFNRYTQYSSVLNIYGFQAYYGGQHSNSEFSGPRPFFGNEYHSESSDISTLVRESQMTAGEIGFDYQTMRVSDALNYSDQLANYLTTRGVKPVRTNFPPVKIQGNVLHATGAGMHGEKAVVLSTVAFKPAYGMADINKWQSSTLEVGAPFEDAGQYLVTVYFKVNTSICQQSFFFEIVNSAKIAFEVSDAFGEKKTYYAGELELNNDLTINGNKIKISYDGNTTLGQYEVPPTISLDYAHLGSLNFYDMQIPAQEGGAFEFSLNPGQYRLTVEYGAHNKSATVFNLVVDDTPATGIKINTSAKSLPGLPNNVAVVGAGEVSLTWEEKVSGVKYNNVLCEFYEMKPESTSSDPNVDRNYFEPNEISLKKLKNLYSAYAFVKDPSIPNNGYVPVKTATGWTLNETFKTPGLYNFTIIDDVGNQTQFVLIIDNSTPTFVQSGEKNSNITNAVNFNENGVLIGFGVRKLVAGQMFSEFNTILGNAGILVNDMRQVADIGREQISFGIGLEKIEYSKSGAQYQTLSKEDIKNGYIVLKEEETYYFRVTDVLGNVGEYYIILTHDNCIGTVYADSIRPTISTANEDMGRGIVTSTPNINTSLVTGTGGMTNRPFVTFSFEQKSQYQQFCVDRVYLQYYPLTYQTKSSFDSTKKNENYPFADKQVNNPAGATGQVFANQATDRGVIYTYRPGDENKQTIRLALFNHTTTTPSGLYIITRVYKAYSGNDTSGRDYHFIVDNQKMLYYNEDGSNPYQTGLRVKFANQKNDTIAKTALARDIHNNNNELSSNRTAWVSGFVSKYSYLHDSITYSFTEKNANHLASFENPKSSYNFNFPSLAPRFSYEHNNQIVELGEGSGMWAIGDPTSDSNLYKVLIRDDARNISCMLVNGNCTELMDIPNSPTSANYDYLTLDLELGNAAKGEFQIDNGKIITNAGMQYDGAGFTYIVDPEDISELKFAFESDPASMEINIMVETTTASWVASGFNKPLIFAVPKPVNHKYTFDLMNNYLTGMPIENGSSLSITLFAQDGTSTKYTVLFDTVNPGYNLGRVKSEDNLACDLSFSELPGDYIFGLSSDFVFESDQVNNPYLETQFISYREVDYSGEGTQPAVQFSIYQGQEAESSLSFAQIIGLRDNEMKYYMITETDYAGNNTDYLVQVQGDKYVNNVSFIGAITGENDEIQIGCEMHASKSSVHQFFVNNNSFKFESGDEYYTVLGSTASWRIGNDVGTGDKSEENLINALNNWINVATENGTKCAYTLYDRIGEKEVYEFYNIRESAAKIQLDCYQASAGSSVIMTSVTNYTELPKILFDERLASLFRMTVKDNTSKDVETEVVFTLEGTAIQGFDVSHELIITVVDPFGRVSTTEYHQQRSSTLNFTVNGNTVTQDGILYIGDERGVAFSYLRTAYNVLIYDANSGDVLTNLQPFISNDMINYTFVPKPESTTLEKYRIVATGRASGSILFDKTFAFDTRLPSVEWKNASDQSINVEGHTFVSDVCFDISNSLVPTSFPVTVSYTRNINGRTERVTLKPGTQKYTFKQAGKYTVTLRNTVWAEKNFSFEIEQIDDNLVIVYDDEQQIKTSPSDYKFTPDKSNPSEFIYIPRYVFTTNGKGDSIENYDLHGLKIKIGQTNRILAGNMDLKTEYYYFDNVNNTIVWRLAFLLGENNGVPIYDNPIYFATTGVASGELNTGSGDSVNSPITLQLNGHPNNSNINSKTFTVTPSLTTYHFIDDSFMLAHDEKVEVKLSCSSTVLRDENNLPYYMTEGNVIVVDCYYNGQLVKTLYGDGDDQVFTINRYDAGYYEFVVHDLVGNYLYFGNSADQNNVNYRQERYMLIVMTKPMVLINGKQPVNGMIYNDRVELKLVDYGNKFLSKLYADELQEDELFFTKCFCISKVEVIYTGSNGQHETVMNVDGRQNSFYWSNSGTYRVKITYRISDNIIDDLKAEYYFQIIPAQTTRESFSMPIYPDVQVVSVMRNGYQIHDFDNLQVNDNMEFSADTNPGSYVITLRTYNSIVGQYVTHDIKFNIQVKANSASNYFVLSSGSGTTTVGAVTVYYNPYWLYQSQGQMTIYLYKNNKEHQKVYLDQSAYNSSNYNTQELFTVKDAGLYTLIARDADGDPVYMDSWSVKEKESTFGYIVLAVVLGIVAIVVLVFLRMRRKMSTK